MFQCAWCKREKDVWEWTKDSEQLCRECAPKYHFGMKRGMIAEKVSDLTKEQRRKISSRINILETFWSARRYVEKKN